jgi:hypothetical protein
MFSLGEKRLFNVEYKTGNQVASYNNELWLWRFCLWRLKWNCVCYQNRNIEQLFGLKSDKQ